MQFLCKEYSSYACEIDLNRWCAAFLGIKWFDYLDLMWQGFEQYGPVRAGVYTMTGCGETFMIEE